jgi:hypothetical protein
MMQPMATHRKLPALVAAALLGGGLVSAAPALASGPRYADKDTALEVAKVLDKSVFRNHLVTSTFIQSVERDKYVIKVVLDNGAEQDWDMNQIRAWTKDESITLQKNRALIFPHDRSNIFVVLDKNRFTQKALRTRVLVRQYPESDVLAGQSIRYGVYQFNLVDLLNINPGTDEQGYRHRYVFDLENGQRELVSYRDAYFMLQQNDLIEDPAQAGGPVMRTPYELRAINPRELEIINGAGRFGLELVFDRALQLEPGHFPFQLYEKGKSGAAATVEPPFLIEFTAPNAILPVQVTPIPNLEFLRSIAAVSDDAHQNRVLVRAKISPDVLTQPPEVSVKGQSVVITFTKVQDQSVFDRQALLEADLRRRQDKLLSGSLTAEEIQRRNNYRQLMETGLGQVDKARVRKAFQEKFDLLVSSLSNFSDAAVNASNDRDLEEALKERNSVLAKLPALVMDQASAALKQKPVPDKDNLRKAVVTVLGFTREPKTVARLKELQQALAQ